MRLDGFLWLFRVGGWWFGGDVGWGEVWWGGVGWGAVRWGEVSDDCDSDNGLRLGLGLRVQV